MIGQTISHYRILEELDSGGMGVVYKAEDMKLKRTVALKFLPPELTHDKTAKTRFIHEAQAASALQHHNICTIHEIDETKDGRLFIAMDCYDGETLRETIARGPIAVGDAVNIATQVAEGLSEAHRAGMVHRDVKPANVMLTRSGVAKILDFGLAKLAGMTKVTKTGTTVGTVAYMSPEQATGKELDARSDIWSLGVVLYEMLTGQLPFKGDHEQAVVYQIVNGEPEPLTECSGGAPAGLIVVVDKSLQKDPGKRYQTVAELRDDLRAVISFPDTLRKPRRHDKRLMLGVPIVLAAIAAFFLLQHFRPSPPLSDLRVALFDFSLLAAKPDPITVAGLMAAIQVGLADADEYTLVSPEYLRDIQRRKLKLVSESIPAEQMLQVAREAKATLMVTGEVVEDAKGSQVTWRLVETQEGKVVKAGRVDENRWSDQADEVVQVVGGTLLSMAKSKGGSPPATVVEKTSSNEEAYRHYAAALVNTEAGHLDDARRDLLLAVKMDSTFALAYFALSRNYNPNNEMVLAQRAADRAWDLRARLGRKERGLLRAHKLFLDYKFAQAVKAYQDVLDFWPDNKEALIGRAQTHFYFRSWKGARTSAEDGLRFYPNEEALLQVLAAAMSQLGDWAGALEIARKTTNLRSGSIDAMGTLGDIYLRMAQPDSAARAYRQTLALEPLDLYSAMGLSRCAYGRGDLETAIQMQEKLLRDSQYTEAKRKDLLSTVYLLGLPVLYSDAGRLKDARKLLAEADTTLPNYIFLLPYVGLVQKALPLFAEDRQRVEKLGSSEVKAFYKWYEACCLARVGEIEKAEVLYKELVQLVAANPDLPRGFYQRNLELAALIALAKKEPRDALGDLDQLFDEGFKRLGPGEILILETKAEVLVQAGQLNEAIAVLQDLVRVYGGRALAHFRLGELLEKTGRYYEAREAYSRCLALWSKADPDYPYPLRARARLSALE